MAGAVATLRVRGRQMERQRGERQRGEGRGAERAEGREAEGKTWLGSEAHLLVGVAGGATQTVNTAQA